MPEFQGQSATVDAGFGAGTAGARPTTTVIDDGSAGRGRGLFDFGRGQDTGGAVPTGMLLGAAAVGIGIGLLANMGRKAAVQGASLMQGDWFDALRAEHRAALAIFDQIEKTTPADTGKRSTLLAALKNALQKHAFQEENVIYPSIREAGERGDADQLDHEHAYVKTYLLELEMMGKSDPRWLTRVREFRDLIEKHVHEEEDEIYPALRAKLSDAENKKLTALMNKEGLKLA